mmetsp:Transcript_8595/g.17798  ORF Transcript_8595/g.17798 Transcript_8595/m.17798 type:complete len:81 (-) Transcript_8595:468-710(-)
MAMQSTVILRFEKIHIRFLVWAGPPSHQLVKQTIATTIGAMSSACHPTKHGGIYIENSSEKATGFVNSNRMSSGIHGMRN